MSNLSPAQPTNLIFEDMDFFTRPYYSYDNRNWIEFPAPSGNVYSIPFTKDQVWIAHSTPYLTSHEQELIDDVQGPDVQTSALAVSEGGRPVRLLTITRPDGLPGDHPSAADRSRRAGPVRRSRTTLAVVSQAL